MIIFLKSEIESIDYFEECMAIGQEDVWFLDPSAGTEYFTEVAKLDSRIDQNTIVITVNNSGLGLSMADGKNYWQSKNVRFFDYLVDHPINYMDAVSIAIPNMQFITIDEHHCSFMKQYFPQIREQVRFLPHGGVDLGWVNNQTRPIDVLYIGNCQDEYEMDLDIEFLRGKEKDFFKFCYDSYMRHPYFEMDDVVRDYLGKKELMVTYEQELFLIAMTALITERCVMHDHKKKLMIMLAQSGIKMELHGKNWEWLKKEYPEQIDLGGYLDSKSCIEKLGNCKVALNMHPRFTYGTHERVFNSMLNGAVCVSNQSKYLESRFVENEDIAYIDFDYPENTVDKIKDILNHEELRISMQHNAYGKVQNDTWQARLQQMVKNK